MRKPLIVVLSLALLVAFATAAVTGAMAEDKTQVDIYENQQLVKGVIFVIGQDQYFINNQTPGVKMDAKPFIDQGRTFVPVRYLSNALGVQDEYIGWENPKVGLNQPGFPVVELAVGSKQIISDGEAKTMDVSPLLKQGRTYLPARWVAEALGYEVAWDAENQVVLCWPRGTEKPDVSNVINYINEQSPVVTPEQPVTTEDVVQFTGKPLNPNDYTVAERKAIPGEFTEPGASIMYVTVDELRQKPVKMGDDNDGYEIIYDVKVSKDNVYVTEATSSLTPSRLILAIGNDVSRQRDNTIVKYSNNPFTHGYTVSLDADPGGGTKIEDVTHIMLMYSNQVLAVENPLYKGAK